MRRELGLVVLLTAALGGVPSLARAQDGPAGTLTLNLLTTATPELGGALGADLWLPLDIWRIGGFFGVGVLPSEDDTQNRVFMPLAASIGIEALGDVVGVSLRGRAGLWGGATQDVKLTVGGLVGGGAYLLFILGGGASLSVGVDVWGLFGDGETALFAPGAGLTWTPTAH